MLLRNAFLWGAAHFSNVTDKENNLTVAKSTHGRSQRHGVKRPPYHTDPAVNCYLPDITHGRMAGTVPATPAAHFTAEF